LPDIFLSYSRDDQATARMFGRFIINRVLDNAAAPITLILNWNPDPTRH
jgi:hypothetical protein